MQKTSLQRLEESEDTADKKLNGHMNLSSAESVFHNSTFCPKIHSGGDQG